MYRGCMISMDTVTLVNKKSLQHSLHKSKAQLSARKETTVTVYSAINTQGNQATKHA
jgi:hypothetical protein